METCCHQPLWTTLIMRPGQKWREKPGWVICGGGGLSGTTRGFSVGGLIIAAINAAWNFTGTWEAAADPNFYWRNLPLVLGGLRSFSQENPTHCLITCRLNSCNLQKITSGILLSFCRLHLVVIWAWRHRHTFSIICFPPEQQQSNITADVLTALQSQVHARIYVLLQQSFPAFLFELPQKKRKDKF